MQKAKRNGTRRRGGAATRAVEAAERATVAEHVRRDTEAAERRRVADAVIAAMESTSSGYNLSIKELDFVDKLGDGGPVSEKQLAWLRDIYAKVEVNTEPVEEYGMQEMW